LKEQNRARKDSSSRRDASKRIDFSNSKTPGTPAATAETQQQKKKYHRVRDTSKIGIQGHQSQQEIGATARMPGAVGH
jgi:hypothetical protein